MNSAADEAVTTVEGSSRASCRQRLWWYRALLAIADVYCLGVIAWGALFLLFGDRWWWLFIINSFSVFLFLPLPVVALVALVSRRPALLSGSALVLGLGGYLHGGKLIPPRPPGPSGAPELTVLTWNVLGFATDPQPTIDAIRGSGADVVVLQELYPALAESIAADLGQVYPFQLLRPLPGVQGKAVISKLPFRPVGMRLRGAWVGVPLVLDLLVEGSEVTLVNFHAIRAGGMDAAHFDLVTRKRERQAQQLVWLAAHGDKPFIAAGDLNAADVGGAYRILTEQLEDAWTQAGFGFGHTFPVAVRRPPDTGDPLRSKVPFCLIRLDYIFLGNGLRAVETVVGNDSGSSDHRYVMTRIRLPAPMRSFVIPSQRGADSAVVSSNGVRMLQWCERQT